MLAAALLLPLLMLALGAGMLAYAFGVLADVAAYGAGFMPAVIGGLMVVLAVLDLAATARAPAAHTDGSAAPSGRAQATGLALTTASVVFYLLAVDTLGFMLTGSLIVVALLAPLLQRHRLVTLALAVVAVAGVDYLFSRVLLVPLPAGSLFS